jgi:hypothetical protein
MKSKRGMLNAWKPVDGYSTGQRMYLEGQNYNNKIYRGIVFNCDPNIESNTH